MNHGEISRKRARFGGRYLIQGKTALVQAGYQGRTGPKLDYGERLAGGSTRRYFIMGSQKSRGSGIILIWGGPHSSGTSKRIIKRSLIKTKVSDEDDKRAVSKRPYVRGDGTQGL